MLSVRPRLLFHLLSRPLRIPLSFLMTVYYLFQGEPRETAVSSAEQAFPTSPQPRTHKAVKTVGGYSHLLVVMQSNDEFLVKTPDIFGKFLYFSRTFPTSEVRSECVIYSSYK